MKRITIVALLVMFLLVGCGSDSEVIVPKSSYDFGKALDDIKFVDDKYDVVEGKVLPQHFEGLIFDYEGLESKLESMDSSQDVEAAILLVKFKLNMFRSRDKMRVSSFNIGDNVCGRMQEFDESVMNAEDAVDKGKEAISSVDNFIKNYPAQLKKAGSDDVLGLREELESDVNRLESNTQGLKDYVASIC